MGFFSRLGKKISGGLESAGRLGKKVLGAVSRVGHKISHVGGDIVGGIERVPVLGQALAPVTGVARSALGMIENVASGADKGLKALNTGERLVREGTHAIRTGDVQQAQSVLREGMEGAKQARSNLEKAKKSWKDK